MLYSFVATVCETLCLFAFSDPSGLSPEVHYKIGATLAVLGNFVIAISLNVQVP